MLGRALESWEGCDQALGLLARSRPDRRTDSGCCGPAESQGGALRQRPTLQSRARAGGRLERQSARGGHPRLERWPWPRWLLEGDTARALQKPRGLGPGCGRGPTNNQLAAPSKLGGLCTCFLPGPGSLPSAGRVRRGHVTARGSGQAWDLRRRQIHRGRRWGGLGTPLGGPRVCRRGYTASCHTDDFWEDVWAAGWRALGGCSLRVPPSRGSSTGPAAPAASRRLPSPLALLWVLPTCPRRPRVRRPWTGSV